MRKWDLTPVVNEMNENEMITYYAKRASEYERIYQRPERQRDLKQLQTAVADSFEDCNLLEIACGTGYWTQFACKSALSIVATDYNEEVLDIAKEKDYGGCSITFVRSDDYALDNVNGPLHAALVGFWWSHVPKEKLGDFLKVLHAKLSKGATVVMFDNRYVEGNSTPVNRVDDEGNTYQIRSLSDGSEYEVLKNFPVRNEFVKRIEHLSERAEFIELDYFWLARYTV